jgi:hypothetical protein
MENQARQVVVPTQELLSVLSSIQLASSRGSFRPEEFVEIGTAYQKIFEFLTDLGAINSSKSSNQANNESIQAGVASGLLP